MEERILQDVGLPGYVVGSRSFRPDIQKPREMENAVRDIHSAIYGEVNVSVEKCVEIKGNYVEKSKVVLFLSP